MSSSIPGLLDDLPELTDDLVASILPAGAGPLLPSTPREQPSFFEQLVEDLEPPEETPEYDVRPVRSKGVDVRYVVPGSIDLALEVEERHRGAEHWMLEHYAGIEAQRRELHLVLGLPLHRIEVRHDFSDPSCITSTIEWPQNGSTRRKHICTEVPATAS